MTHHTHHHDAEHESCGKHTPHDHAPCTHGHDHSEGDSHHHHHDHHTHHAHHGHSHGHGDSPHHHGHGGCCHGHGSEPHRQGILLAAFGTSIPEAQEGYDRIEQAVRERFPDTPVYRAFTADKVRRKMCAQGVEAMSVAQALVAMRDQGLTHVAVQSLHAIPGLEFEWMEQQAKAFIYPRKGFRKVFVGAPLITNSSLAQVVDGLTGYLPDTLAEDEGVVLVGHGSYHAGQVHYHALQSMLHYHAPRVFVGTLMGDGLGIGVVMQRLKAAGIKRVHLIPFMCVPGHHAVLDMFGEQSGSWLRALTAHGWACQCHSKGLAMHTPFVELWLHNLGVALRHLPVQTEGGCCAS